MTTTRVSSDVVQIQLTKALTEASLKSVLPCTHDQWRQAAIKGLIGGMLSVDDCLACWSFILTMGVRLSGWHCSWRVIQIYIKLPWQLGDILGVINHYISHLNWTWYILIIPHSSVVYVDTTVHTSGGGKCWLYTYMGGITAQIRFVCLRQLAWSVCCIWSCSSPVEDDCELLATSISS